VAARITDYRLHKTVNINVPELGRPADDYRQADRQHTDPIILNIRSFRNKSKYLDWC
jgi:hypothetical protein